jgi:hypothetical protein
MKTRFWNFITRSNYTRVIRVKSIMPSWDEHHNALAWPTLLVDEGTQRRTATPIWTAPRYAFWRKL